MVTVTIYFTVIINALFLVRTWDIRCSTVGLPVLIFCHYILDHGIPQHGDRSDSLSILFVQAGVCWWANLEIGEGFII